MNDKEEKGNLSPNNSVDFKYQEDIKSQNLSIACPQQDTFIFEGKAYRWIKEPLDLDYNWLPRSVIRIRDGRVIPPSKRNDDEWKCNEWGLSMFLSKQGAIDFYNNISPKIKSKLGYTHVAEVVLKATDGRCTKPEESEHFNLHELSDASFNERTQVICKIN